MNYDPDSREVIGSVDHSVTDYVTGLEEVSIPHATYVGCCGDVHSHTVHHGTDCRCFQVGTVPDVEGRDVALPHDVIRRVPSTYDDDGPIGAVEVDRRIAERSMWALESIANSLRALRLHDHEDDQKSW